MSEVTPEPRTAVMILVEASWEDQVGTMVTARVRMENKSATGACIRIKRRIEPGTKVHVQWRWGEFSGVVKYCKYEAGDYRVWIRRDPVAQETEEQLEAVRVTKEPETARRVDAGVREVMRDQEALAFKDPTAVELSVRGTAPGTKIKPSEERAAEMEQRGAEDAPREEIGILREKQVLAKEQGKEVRKERKNMGSKLMQLTRWRKKEEGPHGSGNAGNGASGAGGQNGAAKHGAQLGVASALAEKSEAEKVNAGVENIHVELLPMEDIYRAAGIVNPRRGYSVTKVVRC